MQEQPRDLVIQSPDENLCVNISVEDQQLKIYRSHRSGCAVLFMLVWLSGWTAGVVMLIYHAIMEPSLKFIVFSCLFAAAWVGGVIFLVWNLSGQETLWIGPDGVRYRLRMWGFDRTRLVPLQDVAGVDHEGEQDLDKDSIIIRSSGKPLKFGRDLTRQERAQLADIVLRRIEELKHHPVGAVAASPDLSAIAAQSPMPASPFCLFRPDDEPVPRPENARAELVESDGMLVIQAPHRVSLFIVIFVTGFALFWNILIWFVAITVAWKIIIAWFTLLLMICAGLYMAWSAITSIRRLFVDMILIIDEQAIISNEWSLRRSGRIVPTNEVRGLALLGQAQVREQIDPNDPRVNQQLVLLDVQMQPRMSIPVESAQEGEWLASQILARFPHMGDLAAANAQAIRDRWADDSNG